MFKNYLCGANTGHPLGFVYKNDSSPHFVLLHFKTPFFCIIEGKRIEGAAGECLLQRKGSTVIHGPLSDNEQFINDWIYFEADEELGGLPFDVLLAPEDHNSIGLLIEYILKEEAVRDEHSQRLISDAIYRMLAVLQRTPSNVRDDQMPDMPRFKDARSYVLTHCGERWSLAKMAALTGYSVSRFCALWSECFGTSPMDDLLDRRLELAKQLLALSAYKIGDIAAMCGFSSIHYFSRFFKRRVGISPSDYIK